MISHFKSL